MTILILGNGLSRLDFTNAIRSHQGPVWACNRAYLDFSDTITHLYGHEDVMQEAREWREENGKAFSIFGQDEELTCRSIFRKDSGTTLVAEALTRGADVIVCGFDLGGADLYSPGHEKKNKATWVERWRFIFGEFDPGRVTFWGHDHKPFILSQRPANEYAREYMHGKAHIPATAYQEALKDWKNDYSRVWDNIPLVYLKNLGARDWKFQETKELLPAGGKIKLPECVAQKYIDLYRREFEIEKLPKTEKIDMVV